MLNALWVRNPRLIFRVFADDDFVAAFDTKSGDTHVIGRLAYDLYMLLEYEALSACTLCEAVVQQFPDEDNQLITEAVDSAILQMLRCDIIHQAEN